MTNETSRKMWMPSQVAKDLMESDFKHKSRNYFVVADSKTFSVKLVPYHEYKRKMGHIVYETYNCQHHFGLGNPDFSYCASNFFGIKDFEYAHPFARAICSVMESDLMKTILSYPKTETLFICYSNKQIKAMANISKERELQPYEESIPVDYDTYAHYSWMQHDKPWSEVLRKIDDENLVRFIQKFIDEVEVPQDIHTKKYKKEIYIEDNKFKTRDLSTYDGVNIFSKEAVVKKLEDLYRDNKANKYRKLSTKGDGNKIKLTFYHGGDTSITSRKTVKTSSDEETAIVREFLESDCVYSIDSFAEFIFKHKDFKRAYYDLYSMIGWNFILKDNEVLSFIMDNMDKCSSVIEYQLSSMGLFETDNKYDDWAPILKYTIA